MISLTCLLSYLSFLIRYIRYFLGKKILVKSNKIIMVYKTFTPNIIKLSV